MEIQILDKQSFQISEEDSKRITSLRFLLIVFVVFIHANLTPDFALNYYHYDFIQPKWIELFKDFVCSTLGGAAVPLFFLFSSYLQFSKNDSYPNLLTKRCQSLLLPYILWTILTVILYFIVQTIPQTASYFTNPQSIVRNWKGFDWIKIFTYHSGNNPFVYQFWFLRDLIILIIFSPILKLLCKKIPSVMLVLVSVLAVKEIPVFFTQASTLFFYLAGYYFATYKISFFKIADKIKIYEYLVLLALTILFDLLFEGKYNFGFIKILITCLFFLKLSESFVRQQNLYKKLEYLADYSFFLYAVHAPFLCIGINKISQRIIPLHGILCLVQFLLAAFLTLFFGIFLGILLNKTCSPVFKILNGGR